MSLITPLAGLYSGTSAPQGKAGSATDVMSDAKRSIVMQGGRGYDVITMSVFNICVDLERLAQRHDVPPLVPSCHPQKTLYAMRLLAACPNMSIRSQLTHSLYKVCLCVCVMINGNNGIT